MPKILKLIFLKIEPKNGKNLKFYLNLDNNGKKFEILA